MHKVNIFSIFLAIVILTGCSAQKQKTDNTIKTTTHNVLKSSSKTWTFAKKVTSKQTPNNGVSNELSTSVVSKIGDISNWTTSKNQFITYPINYKQVPLKKWQHDTQKSVVRSEQNKVHWMTIAQINMVLKKLGADIKIDKLSDLVFLETKSNNMPLNQAFVAKGYHLYAINPQYTDNEQTITVDRGQSFTDTRTKKATGQIVPAKLNGTWIAPETTTSVNDTGKIMVKDGYLYQHRYDSYERSAIQGLSSYSLMSLNQNTTYASQKTNAARAGYQLTQKSVASGDSLGYLYMFVNENKLIRIGQGQTTTYQKTSSLVAANDLPKDDITIFEQLDQKKTGEAASTITVKAGPPIVGMSSSIKYLTNPDAGQITSNIPVVGLEDGRVTISDEESGSN